MKNNRILLGLLVLLVALALLPTSAFAADFSGSGTVADPYVITTAEELYAIRDDLSANYKLGDDIDLLGSAWTPIGTFESDADDPSGEVPHADYAFTGSFDGAGYTISNLMISDGVACVGLFGVVAGATVENLIIEDADIAGYSMVGAAIGYAYNSTVDNVRLTNPGSNNTITGNIYDGAAPNMIAGIVGAGMDSTIANCSVADTTITVNCISNATTWGENVHDIGLVGGGLEGCNLANCSAGDSSIIADGAYCFGIGGLSGCAFGAEEVTECAVSNVSVTVGDYAYLVGGLLGYTGQEGDEATQVSDCHANVNIIVGSNSSRIGGLIGGGFYIDVYAEYFPVPTRFDLAGCTTGGTLTAGSESSAVGTVVGYACLGNTLGGTSTMFGDLDEVGTDQMLDAVTGTYQALFEGATFESKYDHYWHDYCAVILGADNADAMVTLLKASVGASTYGAAATDTFFCGFAEGVNTFTFNGSQISGYDEDGAQIFSHSYRFIGSEEIAGVMPVYIFQSADNNNDEFKYFLLCADTPDTTYHIEFRYGSDVDDLLKISDGPYANWLASGILASALADPNETMIENVIALFCLENLDYSAARSASSLSQLVGFVGTWDADLSTYPEFADSDLYCVLDTNGNGKIYAYGQQANDYKYYAYENDSSMGSGIYVAYDNTENEFESCKYTFTTNSQGKTVLTLLAEDGIISWIKRTSTSPSRSGSSSSSSSSGSSSSYAVSVSSSVQNGTVSVSPKNAGKGDTVTITITPDSGYELDSLTVTDKADTVINCTKNSDGTYTFTMPDSTVTIQATFKEIQSEEIQSAALPTELPFTDVASSDWFCEAVKYVYENSIMQGTSSSTFEPNTKLNRAMMVQILYNLEGAPASDNSGFDDVADNAWYADAIAWAANSGIVNGVGDNLFAPTAEITREQMAVMLYNYCVFKSVELPVVRGSGSFADSASISSWAEEAVNAMYQGGILNGKGEGVFDPQGTATRAEVATMFMNFLQR